MAPQNSPNKRPKKRVRFGDESDHSGPEYRPEYPCVDARVLGNALNSQEAADSMLAKWPNLLPMLDQWMANFNTPDADMRVEEGPRSGRLSPRWLHDLYLGMLADREGDTGDLFTRCENLPDRLSLPRPNGAALASNGHELLSIDIQCPEATVKSELISCICRHCKYHFLFHFEQDSPYSCATPDSSAKSQNGKGVPCHLVLVESHVHVPTAEETFNPITCTGEWHCSSEACSVRVSVAVSKPRMKIEHIKLIVDERRIARQRQQAIEMDPVRFQNLKPDLEFTALPTLNAYLRDCLGKTKEEPAKKIATRNKRFYIQFGSSCSPIFEYLGLEKRVVDDEEYWFLPALEHYDNEKTPIGTHRAFIEDARSEIQALIEEQGGQQSGGVVKPWTEALYKLKRALNCPWWDTTGKKIGDDEADFKILGTLPNPDEDVLKYAYQRQVETDPFNKKLYCDALQRLASNRSGDLQIFSATEASLIEQSEVSANTPLAQAYSHFNLPPDCSESDDFIIRKYKVFVEQSPAQKVQHRQKLFLIGRERNSKAIAQMAAGGFSFEEACDYLQLDPAIKEGNVPSVEPLDYYVSGLVDNGESRYMVAAALTAVADHFDSTSIRSFAADVRRQGFEDAEAWYRDLLAQDSLATSSQEPEPVDLNLPPGLDNLRNTCYLNSILQYLYTVTPVRELVLNYDPTAAGLSIDLASQNEEIYLGREFVLELQKLFKSLGTATTRYVKPQQRLANAAWLSPDKVNAADAAQKTASPPTPPPLPARPAPIPSVSTTAADSTVVTVAPIDPTAEDSPAGSMASSQTLVNNPLESSYEMMDRDDQPAVVDKGKDTAADVQPETRNQLRALMAALDQTEVVGTDQMDVEEVMGRCINHLRAAINPSSIIHANDAEHQRDIITDTFYISFANMRMEVGKNQYNRSISYERWVTANPGVEGQVHLYEALDNFFDRETIGEKILSYTAIIKPPPIFHICIQRSKVGGGKNTNPVEIPEVLYLDRYMEADETSPIYKARVRSWTIKAQLEQIAAAKAAKEKEKKDAAARTADAGPKVEAPAPGLDNSANRYLAGQALLPSNSKPSTTDATTAATTTEDYVVISPEVKDVLAGSPEPDPSSPGSSSSGGRAAAAAAAGHDPFQHAGLEVDLSPHIDTDLTAREAVLRAELAGLFTGLEGADRTQRYRLHAVICHAGQTAKSGHYWVWIYDFAARVWRRYNDTAVTERPERGQAALLAELSAAAEPYYLAYVRDEDCAALVDVPSRRGVVVPDEEEEEVVVVREEAGVGVGGGVAEGERMEIDLTGGEDDEGPPPYSG